MATIPGGGTVKTPFGGDFGQVVQPALTAASQGFATSDILTSPNQAPTPGAFDIYDFKPDNGESFTLPGGAQAVILTGAHDASITGHTGLELLIGNKGEDTINAAGGTGTVIAGGKATILLNSPFDSGGNILVETKNHSTIDMWGGSVTVQGLQKDTVNIYGGDNTVDALSKVKINLAGGGNEQITGNAQINVTDSMGYTLTVDGNDTISFGSGADTFAVQGTATVTSGASGVQIVDGLGTASMAAGSGASTLIGGSGDDTFVGGTGNTLMQGGAGANAFFGGSGFDTMVAGGTSDIFTFSRGEAGGQHVIDNFTPGADKINLQGYDSASALAHSQVVGGNTVITLDHGHTTITVVGDTHLTPSDFTH